MHHRSIIHVDLDAFYVQCAVKRDPTLLGKPIGIVQKYLLATCSYEARAFGVGKLMRTEEALKRCPGLVLVDGSDLTWFRRCSSEIHSLLKREAEALVAALHTHVMSGADQGQGARTGRLPGATSTVSPHAGKHIISLNIPVEKLVMEEFWLDVSDVVNTLLANPSLLPSLLPEYAYAPGRGGGSGHVYQPSCGGDDDQAEEQGGAGWHARDESPCPCGCEPRLRLASHIAHSLRTSFATHLGFTASAGVSVSKMAAKMASGMHKPNDQTMLLPRYVPGLLLGKKAGDLPGIGWHTSQALHSLGIHSVKDLLGHPAAVIAARTGMTEEAVGKMQALGRGEDDAPVVHTGSPLTVSAEDSFKACTTWEDALGRTREQVKDLLVRLAQDREEHEGRMPRTLRVTIRHVNSGRTSRQVPWPAHTPLHTLGASSMPHDSVVDAVMAVVAPLLRQLVSHKPGEAVRPGHASAPLRPFHLTLINVAGTNFSDQVGQGGSKEAAGVEGAGAGQRSVASYFAHGRTSASADHSRAQNHSEEQDIIEIDSDLETDAYGQRGDEEGQEAVGASVWRAQDEYMGGAGYHHTVLPQELLMEASLLPMAQEPEGPYPWYTHQAYGQVEHDHDEDRDEVEILATQRVGHSSSINDQNTDMQVDVKSASAATARIPAQEYVPVHFSSSSSSTTTPRRRSAGGRGMNMGQGPGLDMAVLAALPRALRDAVIAKHAYR